MKVVITGASSGIGEALARLYASQGATLALIARRAANLERLRDSLPVPQTGAHCVYAIDVTSCDAVRAAALDFMAREGTPDVVIANAGISGGTLTEQASDIGAFERIIQTNLLATVYTFQPFIAPMRELSRARLVGIASVAGIRGLPGSEAYSASKAAVISYCESLRVELRASSIRVVTIAPGFIATPMTARNPYRMPFLMPVERFALAAVAAIERGSSYVVFPWQMRWIARLLRSLPNPVYDFAFARAPTKPRQALKP
jgi:short-subunit dehydrogenase